MSKKGVKVTKATWTESRTLNVGNYNSVRVEFGIEADVGPEDDVDEVQTRMKRLVRGVVEDECGELLAAKKAAR